MDNVEILLKDAVDEIFKKRTEILEEFCKAYLAETGLMPSQVVMCQQVMPDKIKIWFEKKLGIN